MKNSVCLCYACNKLQGTDSWSKFQQKMGREDPLNLTTTKNKASLESLNLAQLKFLATKYNVKAKGKVVEGFFSDHTAPTGKTQYIKALSKVVTESDIELAKTSTPAKPVVKKSVKSLRHGGKLNPLFI